MVPCKVVPWLQVPAEPPPGMLRPVIVAVRRQRAEGKPGRFWMGFHDGIEIVAPDDGTVRVFESIGVAELVRKDWQ